MRIAIGQINPVIGDFAGNVDKILEYAARARELGAELAVFPEMCVCGYPPLDLVDQASFVEANLQGLRRLQRSCPRGIGVMVGYVDRNREQAGKPLVNAVSLLADGEILATQTKTLLPSYDVFDEARWFQPASSRQVIPFRGERLGIAICEDMWWEAEMPAGMRYPVDPVKELLDGGASLILAPSASPFYSGKPRIRLELAVRHRQAVRGAGGLREHGGRQRQPDLRRPVLLHLRRRPPGVPGRGLPRSSSRWWTPPARGRNCVSPTTATGSWPRRWCWASPTTWPSAASAGSTWGFPGASTPPWWRCWPSGPWDRSGSSLSPCPPATPPTAACATRRQLAGNLGIRLERVSIEPAFQASLESLKPGVPRRLPRTSPRRTCRRACGACCSWPTPTSSTPCCWPRATSRSWPRGTAPCTATCAGAWPRSATC